MAFPMSATRVAVVWLTLAAAMTLNGITRELALKRVFAPQAADAVSAAGGVLLIAVITAVGFRPLATEAVAQGQRAALSVALVLVTVAFETILGRVVDHKSWPELFEHYALWRGNLWPLVLAWLAYMPFLK